MKCLVSQRVGEPIELEVFPQGSTFEGAAIEAVRKTYEEAGLHYQPADIRKVKVTHGIQTRDVFVEAVPIMSYKIREAVK